MPWQINDAPRTLEAALTTRQRSAQIRTLAARMKMHAANAKKHAVINVSLHTMLLRYNAEPIKNTLQKP